MFERLEISREAFALATHAMTRQGAISANIANADTPGYRAVDAADFAATLEGGGRLQPVATRATHLARPDAEQSFTVAARRSPGTESPNGNTVSLENEMVKAADVRQSYDMALAIAKATTGILRTSLGRR